MSATPLPYSWSAATKLLASGHTKETLLTGPSLSCGRSACAR